MVRTRLPEEHGAFEKWAKEQGVKINGVEPAKFKNSGIGILATAPLKKGDVLVAVPSTALLTTDSKYLKECKLPQSCTIHCQLAAYLTLKHNDPDAYHRLWQKVWPSNKEIAETMPIKWPAELHKYLPSYAQTLLSKQQDKLRRDWEEVRHLFPDDEEIYINYWLLINTRTFYWDYPNNSRLHSQVKRRKLGVDDCYALCPFIDYFNHAEEGSIVTSNRDGFKMSCDRDYEIGDEIYVTYGTHSNDFLLVEYGFILSQNKWDDVKLDEVIISHLTKAQTAALKERSFLGNYTMDERGPCFRTQVALRVMLLRIGRVDSFIDAVDDGSSDQEKVEAHLKDLLLDYQTSIRKKLEMLQRKDESFQKEMILRRWEQIFTVTTRWIESKN